jgi:hypothetical protein
MQRGKHMGTAGSTPYSGSTRLAELIQKIRILKSDLSGMINHGGNSKVISRLIMAAGLLDGALEELSQAVSEQKD